MVLALLFPKSLVDHGGEKRRYVAVTSQPVVGSLGHLMRRHAHLFDGGTGIVGVKGPFFVNIALWAVRIFQGRKALVSSGESRMCLPRKPPRHALHHFRGVGHTVNGSNPRLRLSLLTSTKNSSRVSFVPLTVTGYRFIANGTAAE